jgi:methylated-DNA-[protein]-cysteine S-methyltransferase
MLRYCVFPTPLGWIGVAGKEAGLVRITLPRPDRAAAETEVMAGLGPIEVDEAAFAAVRDQFNRYLRGESTEFELTYDESGLSDLTRRIYERCRAIPPGQVLTYAELAAEAGRPGAARAVGRAMATNPWPIAIPCHRVVGSDGTLRGYGGGLPMKAALLAFERGRPLEYDPSRPVLPAEARQLTLPAT